MLCRIICIVQVQRSRHALHADCTAPTRQHEVWIMQIRESICPERSRSSSGNWWSVRDVNVRSCCRERTVVMGILVYFCTLFSRSLDGVALRININSRLFWSLYYDQDAWVPNGFRAGSSTIHNLSHSGWTTAVATKSIHMTSRWAHRWGVFVNQSCTPRDVSNCLNMIDCLSRRRHRKMKNCQG